MATVREIFERQVMLDTVIRVITQAVLMGASIAKMYQRGYLTIAPLPGDNSPNPVTNADLDVTILLVDAIERGLRKDLKRVGCKLIFYAEDTHNEREQRRVPIWRKLRPRAFDAIAPRKDEFFAAGETTLQVLIDAIDGDKQLLSGRSDFVISVSILTENVPRLVVVAHPSSVEDVYIACLCGPPEKPALRSFATLNGRDLKQQADKYRHERDKTRRQWRRKGDNLNVLADVFVAAHLTHSKLEIYDAFKPYFDRLHHQSRGVPLGYCGILGLLGTGMGHYGGYVNPYVSSWDALPGEIVIRALGGIVTDVAGQPIDYVSAKRASIVASLDRTIHAELLSIMEPFSEILASLEEKSDEQLG